MALRNTNSLAGALASLALAYVGIRALEAINPGATGFGRGASGLTLIGFNSIRMDAFALVFTLALSLLTGLLFGLVPALQATRAIVTDAPKGRRLSLGRSRHGRWRPASAGKSGRWIGTCRFTT